LTTVLRGQLHQQWRVQLGSNKILQLGRARLALFVVVVVIVVVAAFV